LDTLQTRDLLLLFVGVAGTWVGAEVLVRGAARLALALGLRPLLVGLTVVAFGTSSPEAVVSFVAASGSSGGIAIGNVVGSNIANIGLILGLVCLIHPMRVTWLEIRRDVVFMSLATILASAAILAGRLDWITGGLLWAVLVVSLVIGIRSPMLDESGEPEARPSRDPRTLSIALLQSVVGLVVLIVAARVMVQAAEAIARAFGIDEAIIGATVVAVGTSIPELATSLVAVARRHYDIGIGNIVGSNLMNLTFVLGTVCLLPGADGISLHGHSLLLVASMVAFTAVFIPMLISHGRVRRREAAVLLVGYAAFSWFAYF
jgi:cation:H+ antiporter